MEEWKEYKLGELCDILDSKRIPLSSSQREKRKGSYPYYGAQGIIDYIDDYIFDGTYLLVAEDGENLKSRKQDIAQIVSGKYWVNNHAHILGENGTCDIKLLCYVLNKTDISGYITGSAQPKLNQANLQAIKIKLPSLQTQQKIAKILSSLDDKIEVNRHINEQLEELAQALFKSWFVDFEPFKDGEFVESELGMIPKGWKVGKYTDMVEIKGGGTPKTDIPEYWNGEIPFFTPKDVNNNVYCIETEKNISELGLSKCNSKLYNKNTVFITARGTVGKVCMAGRNMAMNQTCYALLGKENYGQHFIYLQTINIVERMKKKANGAVFSAITTRDFDSEKIVIPPIEIVRNFSPKIESIYESILRNQQEITHLTNLRDTLLPKLMSGEIDVNDRLIPTK